MFAYMVRKKDDGRWYQRGGYPKGWTQYINEASIWMNKSGPAGVKAQMTRRGGTPIEIVQFKLVEVEDV